MKSPASGVWPGGMVVVNWSFATRFRRDGVITTAPPRMTAENPADPEPRTFDGSVGLDGLQEVVRTARREATATVRPAQRLEDGVEENLVASDGDADEALHRSGRFLYSLREQTAGGTFR